MKNKVSGEIRAAKILKAAALEKDKKAFEMIRAECKILRQLVFFQ